MIPRLEICLALEINKKAIDLFFCDFFKEPPYRGPTNGHFVTAGTALSYGGGSANHATRVSSTVVQPEISYLFSDVPNVAQS